MRTATANPDTRDAPLGRFSVELIGDDGRVMTTSVPTWVIRKAEANIGRLWSQLDDEARQGALDCAAGVLHRITLGESLISEDDLPEMIMTAVWITIRYEYRMESLFAAVSDVISKTGEARVRAGWAPGVGLAVRLFAPERTVH
jgi:hypothetical protein